MSREYRGYEIRRCEESGRCHFEIWKDGEDWGFTSNEFDAEIMIDRRIAR